MENEQLLHEKTMVCNDKMLDYLRTSSKWCKFLAIVGFLGLGLFLLAGLFMMAASPLFNSTTGNPIPFWLFGIVYVAFAIVYFFPVYYMYRFAVLTRQSIPAQDEPGLTEGIKNLKKLFKFTGILMIIILSLYALVLVLVVPVMIYLRAR